MANSERNTWDNHSRPPSKSNWFHYGQKSICERVHQTIGNTLRTTLLVNPPNDLQNAIDLIALVFLSILQSISHGPRSRSSCFHRDMMLDIPLISELISIRNSRQAIIDESHSIANLRELNHDYRVCEQVLLRSTRLRNSMLGGLCSTKSSLSM
jgi:hypothetical protein